MNMLQNGLDWLAKKQKRHVSSRVYYYRDEICYPVNATLGRTKFDMEDDYGVRITAHTIDFLINASDLELIPKVGDRIISDKTAHEVLELGAAGCWRWCDPHGIRRRIHTKRLEA
ncbi:MAG: hypothetical protein FWC50_09255 [Planctomycetaceae bacterium]|nr:hypothetical protein [Planctomycetaceae bacterium]